jgi:hypothetical protein
MSRHRTDTGGGGRVALTVAASAAGITLAGVGGTALFLALSSASPQSAPATPSASSAPATPSASEVVSGKTLSLKIIGSECHVFVRIPGGEVLLDRVLRHGEWARFDDPQLDVVLTDGSAAEVYLNGVLQPRGAAGARQEFAVSKTAQS